MNVNRTKQSSTPNIRWMLVGYDLIVYAVVAVILLVLYGGMDKLSTINEQIQNIAQNKDTL